MTTREDYEAAALAAGMEIQWESDTATLPLVLTAGRYDVYHWNPVDDDGDSRQLEVACKMLVQFNNKYVYVDTWEIPTTREELGTDPCAATRLAVFRCAVEIGKQMKEKS
jgi:hypothetical protein